MIPVFGFPEYRVDESGNVYSRYGGGMGWAKRKGGWIKNKKGDKKRYRTISLTKDGRRYCRTLHRVVWESFHNQTIPEGMEIDHKNGDKADCSIGNLELVTKEVNQKRAVEKRLCPSKENHWKSKYTQEEIDEIRKKYATGNYRQVDLAKEYRTNQSHISQIVRGVIW